VVDKEDIYLALSDVYDPEIRVNIVELGLIYDVQIDGKIAKIKMTLTSPNCPASSEIKNNVIRNAKSLKGIDDVELELAMHCAVAFRERLNDDPTTVQKTMRLRNRLQAGEHNDSLMILWDCFRLQGPRAIEVLQTLKSRLAAA